MKHIKNLHTQDNRCTADPIFVVFQKRRLYGFDTQWGDDGNCVWIDQVNDCVEADDEEKSRLDALEEQDRWDQLNEDEKDFFEQWTKTGFMDIEIFVTACFTEQGAKDYIKANGHNLTKPYIFVDSLYRNQEMIDVRKHLMEISQNDS